MLLKKQMLNSRQYRIESMRKLILTEGPATSARSELGCVWALSGHERLQMNSVLPCTWLLTLVLSSSIYTVIGSTIYRLLYAAEDQSSSPNNHCFFDSPVTRLTGNMHSSSGKAKFHSQDWGAGDFGPLVCV